MVISLSGNIGKFRLPGI